MRSATAVMCLSAALAIPVAAQERAGASEVVRQARESNWAGLEMARGQTVTVEDTSGNKTGGALLQVEETSLTLRVDGAVARIDRARVRRVTSERSDSVKNGALTGAVIGAGMAAVSSCSIHGRKCGRSGRIAFIAFGAALWSAIGASIDSSIDTRVTLYEAPPGPRSDSRSVGQTRNVARHEVGLSQPGPAPARRIHTDLVASRGDESRGR